MSRYGIRVSEDEVNKTIIQGLGGGSDQDDVLDLMEMVSMLLIPTILKAARKEYLREKSEEGHGDDEQEELAVLEESARVDGSRGASVSNKMETGDDGLVPTPRGLLDFVLKMILHDVSLTTSCWGFLRAHDCLTLLGK